MEHKRNPYIGYCSRLVVGLVGFAVVAVSLHRYVATVVLLTAVFLVVLAVTSLALHDADL